MAEIRGLEAVRALAGVNDRETAGGFPVDDGYLGDWFRDDTGTAGVTSGQTAAEKQPAAGPAAGILNGQVVTRGDRQYPVVRVNGVWYVDTGDESSPGDPVPDPNETSENPPAGALSVNGSPDGGVTSLRLDIRDDPNGVDRHVRFDLSGGMRDARSMLSGVHDILNRMAGPELPQEAPAGPPDLSRGHWDGQADHWPDIPVDQRIVPVPLFDEAPAFEGTADAQPLPLDEEQLASRISANIRRSDKLLRQRAASRRLARKVAGVALLGGAMYASFKYSQDTASILGYRPFDPMNMPGIINFFVSHL